MFVKVGFVYRHCQSVFGLQYNLSNILHSLVEVVVCVIKFAAAIINEIHLCVIGTLDTVMHLIFQSID